MSKRPRQNRHGQSSQFLPLNNVTLILQMLAAYFMWKESLDASAAVSLVRRVRPGAVECAEQFEALLKLHRWLSWGGAAFYGRFFVPDQMCNIL